MQEINVCVQGKTYQYEKGTTFLHLAQAWQDQYEDAIILAVFNNKLIELGQVIPGDGDIAFLTTKDKNGKRAYRRCIRMGQKFCMWNILWEQAIIAGWRAGRS